MKRNGKIELLRFIYAFFVVYCHLFKNVIKSDSLFKYSAVAVEFYFILSGFLMAKSSYSNKNGEDIGNESLDYVFKRISSIFYPYVISYIILIAVQCYTKQINTIRGIAVFILECIPDFFLLREFGWANKLMIPNPPAWYLSVLILSTMIVYPLCRKSEWFRKIGSFVIGAWIIGIIRIKYGSLVGPNKIIFGGAFYKGMIRGVAEICLGVFCYELYDRFSRIGFTAFGRFVLLLAELSSFAASAYVIVFSIKPHQNVLGLIAAMVLVIVSFSKKAIGSDFFDNRFFFYLGRISLHIYLSHQAIIILMERHIGFLNRTFDDKQIFLLASAAVFLLANVVDLLSKIVKKMRISRLIVEKN